MDENTIKEAAHAAMAKTILETLDTGTRDAILQKSIVSVIDSYRFRCGIDDVVAEKARYVVAELVQSEEWDRRITDAIQAGFADYLINLRHALPGVIALALHGKDGSSYTAQAAQILKCWPARDAGG